MLRNKVNQPLQLNKKLMTRSFIFTKGKNEDEMKASDN